MPYTVEIDTKAARDIRRLPRQVHARIVTALQALAGDPRPDGCKKLSGASQLWRIRVATYRIIYQVHDTRLLVIIVRVGHRGNVYRGL